MENPRETTKELLSALIEKNIEKGSDSLADALMDNFLISANIQIDSTLKAQTVAKRIGKQIEYDTAKENVARYQKRRSEVFSEEPAQPDSVHFSMAEIIAWLNGFDYNIADLGLRLYFGEYENSIQTIVLRAMYIDKTGQERKINNFKSLATVDTEQFQSSVYNIGNLCPRNCGDEDSGI